MAYQIKIVKLAVVVTNTLNNTVIFAGPRREYYFDEAVLEDTDTIKLIALHNNDNLIQAVPLIPLANSLNEANVPFTKLGFQSFGRTYLGHAAIGIDVGGEDGQDGNSILNGLVDPTTEGINGDFYINTVSNVLFGPKSNDVWSPGTSLVGPQGPAGNALSLTTIGTSGAATLVGDVLNIPQYAGDITYGTTAGTATEGNDSRVLNGQTAFGWGDHSLGGYLTAVNQSAAYNWTGNHDFSGAFTSFNSASTTFDALVEFNGTVNFSGGFDAGDNAITGIGNGILATDGVNLGQVQALIAAGAGSSTAQDVYNAETPDGFTITDNGLGNNYIQFDLENGYAYLNTNGSDLTANGNTELYLGHGEFRTLSSDATANSVNVSQTTLLHSVEINKTGTKTTHEFQSGDSALGVRVINTSPSTATLNEIFYNVLSINNIKADSNGNVILPGGGDALTSSPLSQFAATTKTQLNGVISDGTPLYVGDVTGVTDEISATDINTLLKLNTILTDATLIDTVDARLSDARTPLAHTHTFADITSISGTPDGSKFLRDDGVWTAIPGGGDALVANPLSQFAATTSAQLASVLTDETGSGGGFVRATSPTLVTPILGVATGTSIALTNTTNTKSIEVFATNITNEPVLKLNHPENTKAFQFARNGDTLAYVSLELVTSNPTLAFGDGAVRDVSIARTGANALTLTGNIDITQTLISAGLITSNGGVVSNGGVQINQNTEALAFNTTSALGGSYMSWTDGVGLKGFFGYAAEVNDDIYLVNQEAGLITMGTSGRVNDFILNSAGQATFQSNVTALNYIRTGSTDDDVLLGAGGVTSLAALRGGRLEEDATVTGTKNIDWSLYETFFYTLTGATTFTDTNLPVSGSKAITVYITGNFAPTYPTGWATNISGTYVGTVLNTIVVEYIAASTPFYRVVITQAD